MRVRVAAMMARHRVLSIRVQRLEGSDRLAAFDGHDLY
jgi:hypothetical protein